MQYWPVTLILIYAFGYIGYRLFRAFNLPAAGLVGAMFMTAVLSIGGFPWSPVPRMINVSLQAMVGMMIGSRFNRENLRLLKTLIWPAVAVAGWMVGTGVVAGFALHGLTSLDLMTSIFSASPGGIAEMSVIALDYEVDVSAVALLQFIRIMGTYTLVPLISSRARGDGVREEAAAQDSPGRISGSENEDEREPRHPIVTILVGFAGGYTAFSLGLPAGGIIGSMAAVGCVQSFAVPLKSLPLSIVVLAQIGLGGLLGLSFDASLLQTLGELVVPVIALTVLLLGSGVMLAYILHRLFGWDLPTCLLSCAAAGLTQMGLIALEMDADAVKVSLMHLVRIVAIITILPQIIAIIARLP